MASVADEMSDELDDRIDLTPMLDCVFCLLLFLIIATTFEEDGLFKVTLPKAAHAEVRTKADVVTLLIAKDGRFAIGRDYIPDRQLFTTLKGMKDAKQFRSLLIKGDQDAPYRKVVLAIDTAQALNISEFAFVAARPDDAN